jgi:hypothetical protein
MQISVACGIPRQRCTIFWHRNQGQVSLSIMPGVPYIIWASSRLQPETAALLSTVLLYGSQVYGIKWKCLHAASTYGHPGRRTALYTDYRYTYTGSSTTPTVQCTIYLKTRQEITRECTYKNVPLYSTYQPKISSLSCPRLLRTTSQGPSDWHKGPTCGSIH